MREIADRERIEAFLKALASEATTDTTVYLVGGTSAVLLGWRAATIDVELLPMWNFCAQALAKIERGHARDLEDVRAMVSHGLITGAQVRDQFARIEGELYRYPAVDPASFRRAVDEGFPP